jgi:hypothetical protein
MSEIDEIRAALLPADSGEPVDALTYAREQIHPGLRVRARPFMYVLSPRSAGAMTPVRFARTRQATVREDYTGTGLVGVRFDDEHVAQQANGAGFKPEELHRPNCPCKSCS